MAVEKMMFCPKCGNKMKEGDRFCEKCGAEFAKYQVQQEDFNSQNISNQNDKSDRKKILPIYKILIGEVLLCLVGILAFFCIGTFKCMPEKVVDDYWNARAGANYDQVYEMMEMPSDKLLTKQIFLESQNNYMQKIEFKNYEINEVEHSSAEADTKKYKILYIPNGKDKGEVIEVELVKQKEKKWFFFEQWKIVPTDYLEENIKIIIPDTSQLMINGQKISSANKKIENGTAVLHIPYLFKGEYRLVVSQDGMEDYKALYLPEKDKINVKSLLPSEKTREELVSQAGRDLQNILKQALSNQNFGTVSEYFLPESIKDGKVSERYIELQKVSSDSTKEGITSLKLANIKCSFPEEDSSEKESVTITLKAKYTVKYKAEGILWMKLVNKNATGTLECKLKYRFLDGQWRLEDMPVTAKDFGF